MMHLKGHGVDRAYLFGSYARGEADEISDIDIMIKKGKVRSLMDLGGLGNDLEDALGKEIDIVTEESYTDIEYLSEDKENKSNMIELYLRTTFYEEIKKELILIYE